MTAKRIRLFGARPRRIAIPERALTPVLPALSQPFCRSPHEHDRGGGVRKRALKCLCLRSWRRQWRLAVRIALQDHRRCPRLNFHGLGIPRQAGTQLDRDRVARKPQPSIIVRERAEALSLVEHAI